MFDTKLINPINQIKVAQWFIDEIYSIAPKIGILLNGLFFPSNNLFALCVFYLFIYFHIQIDFPIIHELVESHNLVYLKHHNLITNYLF